MTLIYRPLLCALALFAFVSLGLAVAVAAEGDAAKPAADSAKADGRRRDDAAKTDRSLREQQIYIPYEKLRGVFEKHGRGVFLPYEKFEELWKAAQDKTRPAAESLPPVGAVITEIENEAAVAKDVVQVTAHLKIDLLTEGWHEVPLRLADAALVRATIKNEPARVLGGPNEDHRLLIEKKGKQPEQIELVLEYARAIVRSPGQNSVSFQAPQAAVSRWKVRIPQAGVKVNLHPLIAATEVPPAAAPARLPDDKKPSEEKKPDETVILAFVGAAPTVQIDWTPKSEGATGLTALASVQSEQQVWIQEGITRTRTTLAYAISRAELNQVALEVPRRIQSRQCLRSQRAAVVGRTAGRRFDRAEDHGPVVRAGQGHAVGGRRVGENRRQETCRVAQGARGQGPERRPPAGFRRGPGRFRLAGRGGQDQRPAAGRCQRTPLGDAFGRLDFRLSLCLRAVRVGTGRRRGLAADHRRFAGRGPLEPEKLTLDLTAFYTIERAGVFKLELDVPEGFELRSVTGKATTFPATPRDRHRPVPRPRSIHFISRARRRTTWS